MLKISSLLPREDKFFRLIRDLAAEGSASARHLKTFVESRKPEERAAAAAAIRAAKDAAKRISSDITAGLCTTFITPFDREDIQDFSRDLYRIPKIINKVREFLELHVITDLSDLLPQADVIVQEAKALESIVAALTGKGKTAEIMKQAALLDELESRGDDIAGGLLVALIRNTTDARQLILKKDVYDLLERAIDKYRNAAQIALQIALKHS